MRTPNVQVLWWFGFCSCSLLPVPSHSRGLLINYLSEQEEVEKAKREEARRKREEERKKKEEEEEAAEQARQEERKKKEEARKKQLAEGSPFLPCPFPPVSTLPPRLIVL